MPDALRLAGSVVLGGIDAEGGADGLHRHQGQRSDAAGGSVGRHGGLTKQIDGTLCHQIAQIVEGRLHRNGNGQHRDLPQQLSMEPEILPPHPHHGIFAEQQHRRHHRRQSLRQCRGPGRPGHSPAEHSHKQHVQANIAQNGDDQAVQRCLAVSQAPECTGKQIIHQRADHGDETDLQIGSGFLQGALRGPHPPQDGTGEGQAHHHHPCRQEQPQIQAVYKSPPHQLLVLLAKVPADDDPHAHIDADHQGCQQQDHRHGAAHRRKGGLPEIPPHHDAVGNGVDLIQQVAHQCREGKRPQQGDRLSLCHIQIFLHAHPPLHQKSSFRMPASM